MSVRTESFSEEDLMYTPQISSPGNYRKFLQLSRTGSLSEDEAGNSSGNEGFIDDELLPEISSLAEEDLYPDLTTQDYEKPETAQEAHPPVEVSEEQKQEWHDELEKNVWADLMIQEIMENIKVEGEIATLRQVLGSKVRYSSELKRKLGITPLQEMKNDFQLGLKTIKDSPTYQKTNEKLHDINEKIHQSNAYQKTSAAAKTAADKTSSVVSGIGETVTKKLGDLRNSNAFRSVEGKVESAYASVKAKVSGSKSEGSFEDALLSEKEENANGDAPVTTEQPLPESKVPL